MGVTAAAVILARGGSKGIPGKNLAPVGGVPLVVRAIRAAQAARGVAGVWVSTDDAAIAAAAAAAGAQVIDRPAAISGDAASSEAGWLHALPFLRAVLPGLDRLVFLQCTSAFTAGAEIDRGLALMAERGAACALSVVPDHGFLWAEGADGLARGTNHDETVQRPRRQDLAPVWLENGAFYIVDAARFEAVGRRFCGPVVLVPVDHPGPEIDSPADLAVVRAIAAARDEGAAAPGGLGRIRALVMDFDGVLTDDRVLTAQDGQEAVISSRADGHGIGMLRAAGIAMLILSKERNPVVAARGAKLGIPVLQGVDEKAGTLTAWMTAQGIGRDGLAYVGNDLNDLPAMALAGLAACPSDAHPQVRAAAHWVLPAPGGRGAIRALAEALLAASGGARR